MSVDLSKLPPSGSLILVSIILDYSQISISQAKKHSSIIIVMNLMQMLFKPCYYLLCVDRFDQFRPPRAILVNLEEGGTFAWVFPRLNVIFWWYLKTMIIRFKSAREITNKVTDNKILLQIVFQVLLRFLPVRDEGLFLFDGNLVWIKPKLSQSALNCKMKRQLALPQLTDRKRMRQTLFVFTKTVLSSLFLRFFCVLCHWFVKDGRWSLVLENGSPDSNIHIDLKSLRFKHHLSLTELISGFSGHKYSLYHCLASNIEKGANISNLLLEPKNAG